LSRQDPKFAAAGKVALDPAELLAAFELQLPDVQSERREAIARFLAGAPDWREARERLGGAFAEPPAETGLSGRKAS
jgi:hypothetical protein